MGYKETDVLNALEATEGNLHEVRSSITFCLVVPLFVFIETSKVIFPWYRTVFSVFSLWIG